MWRSDMPPPATLTCGCSDWAESRDPGALKTAAARGIAAGALLKEYGAIVPEAPAIGAGH